MQPSYYDEFPDDTTASPFGLTAVCRGKERILMARDLRIRGSTYDFDISVLGSILSLGMIKIETKKNLSPCREEAADLMFYMAVP